MFIFYLFIYFFDMSFFFLKIPIQDHRTLPWLVILVNACKRWKELKGHGTVSGKESSEFTEFV